MNIEKPAQQIPAIHYLVVIGNASGTCRNTLPRPKEATNVIKAINWGDEPYFTYWRSPIFKAAFVTLQFIGN